MPARVHAVLAAMGATLCAALFGAYLERADRQGAAPLATPRRDGPVAQRTYATEARDARSATERPALAALAAALASADANARVDAIAEVGASGDRQAQDLLVGAAANDGDPAVRAEALRALALIYTGTQESAFKQALADADRGVREAAIAALERVADESAVQSLAFALDDAEPSLRARAADALGEIGGEAAHNLLLRASTDESSTVREVAATRLAQRYPDVYPADRSDAP